MGNIFWPTPPPTQPVPAASQSPKQSPLQQQAVLAADSASWVLAQLVAIFPDACPDAAAGFVRSLEAQPQEAALEVAAERFLESGYQRRVKKYQQLRESGGDGVGPSSAAGRRRAADSKESRAVVQILGTEFPYISKLALSRLCAAHGNRLAPTYCYLHDSLAFHGFSPLTPWSSRTHGRKFALMCAAPNQQQQRQQQQQKQNQKQPLSTFRLQFLRNRRPIAACDVQMRRPDLHLELLAAREQRNGATGSKADSSANPPGDGQSGEAPPDDGALFECECCFGEFPTLR